MKKILAYLLFLCFAVFLLVSCSNDKAQYTVVTGSEGKVYRLHEKTGDIHLVSDGGLIAIPENFEEAAEHTLSQKDVIEDFEIVIRFLDGAYNGEVGEYGLLECMQSKLIPPKLSLSRTRAVLANSLDACIRETRWFHSERPAPTIADSEVPNCGDGFKETPSGGKFCIENDDN